MEENKSAVIEMTADIVSSYVGHNKVSVESLPSLIVAIHRILNEIATGNAARAAPDQLTPAVSIKKSITPDFLISLEDGRKYKSLKRHLRTAYNLSPEEYRAKWNLPKEYPMVAPNYAASRSALAKSMGLGRGGAQNAPVAAPESKRAPRAKTTES